MFQILYLAEYSKVSTFFETLGIVTKSSCDLPYFTVEDVIVIVFLEIFALGAKITWTVGWSPRSLLVRLQSLFIWVERHRIFGLGLKGKDYLGARKVKLWVRGEFVYISEVSTDCYTPTISTKQLVRLHILGKVQAFWVLFITSLVTSAPCYGSRRQELKPDLYATEICLFFPDFFVAESGMLIVFSNIARKCDRIMLVLSWLFSIRQSCWFSSIYLIYHLVLRFLASI